MPKICRTVALCMLAAPMVYTQSPGNFGSIRGVVVDSSKAAIPSTHINLRSQLTGIEKTTTSDSAGAFRLTGIPFGAYQLTVLAPGFTEAAQTISIASPVPVETTITLSVAGTSTSLDVTEAHASALSPTAHGIL